MDTEMVHLSHAEALRLSAHVAHAATAHRQLKEANCEVARAREREGRLQAKVSCMCPPACCPLCLPDPLVASLFKRSPLVRQCGGVAIRHAPTGLSWCVITVLCKLSQEESLAADDSLAIGPRDAALSGSLALSCFSCLACSRQPSPSISAYLRRPAAVLVELQQ